MSSRLLKELRSLAPWQWDARVNLHPAGASSLRDFSLIESAILEAEPGHSKTRQASETHKDVVIAPVQTKSKLNTETAIKDFTPGPSKRPASAGRLSSRSNAGTGSADDDEPSCFEQSTDGIPSSVPQMSAQLALTSAHAASSMDSKSASLDSRFTANAGKRPRRVPSAGCISPCDPSGQPTPIPPTPSTAAISRAHMVNLDPIVLMGGLVHADLAATATLSAETVVNPTPNRGSSFSSRQSPSHLQSSSTPSAPLSASPWVPGGPGTTPATTTSAAAQHSASKLLDFPSAAKQLQVRASLANAMESAVTESLCKRQGSPPKVAAMADPLSPTVLAQQLQQQQQLQQLQALKPIIPSQESSDDGDNAFVAVEDSESADVGCMQQDTALPSGEAAGAKSLTLITHVTAGSSEESGCEQTAVLAAAATLGSFLSAVAVDAVASVQLQGNSPTAITKRMATSVNGSAVLSKSLPSGKYATGSATTMVEEPSATVAIPRTISKRSHGKNGRGATRNSGGVQQSESMSQAMMASATATNELGAVQEEGRDAAGSGFDDILQAVESFCKANDLAPTIENIRSILLSLQLLPAQQRAAREAAGMSALDTISPTSAALAGNYLAISSCTDMVAAPHHTPLPEVVFPIAALQMPPVTTMETTEAEWNSRLAPPVCAVYQQLLSGQRALHEASLSAAAAQAAFANNGSGSWPSSDCQLGMTSMPPPPPQQAAHSILRDAVAAASAATAGMQLSRAGHTVQQPASCLSRYVDADESPSQGSRPRMAGGKSSTAVLGSGLSLDGFPGFSSLSVGVNGSKTGEYARQRKASMGPSSRLDDSRAGSTRQTTQSQHGTRAPTLLASMVSQGNLASGPNTMQQAPVSHSVYGAPPPQSPSSWRRLQAQQGSAAWPVMGSAQQAVQAAAVAQQQQQQGLGPAMYRYPGAPPPTQQQQQQQQSLFAQQQQMHVLSQQMYLQQQQQQQMQQAAGRAQLLATAATLPAGAVQQRQVLKQQSAVALSGLPSSTSYPAAAGTGLLPVQGGGLTLEDQENMGMRAFGGLYDSYCTESGVGGEANKSFNWKKSKMSNV